MKLSKQITLGYALMFFLMLLISVFSIYSIYHLDKSVSNIKGRYTTLSKLLSDNKDREQGFFANEMLLEAVKISDEQLKYSYIMIFTVAAITLVFGIVLMFFIPRMITKPVYKLFKAAESVAEGDYSIRVVKEKSSSEINTLISAFNHMIDNIERNNRELNTKNQEILSLLATTKKFNEILESEIEAATKEIMEKHKELIRSEKLATIGELASGVAHEVRNPLSGIAIALELMMEETDNQEHQDTITEILDEIGRLERIVKGLFQLGHPERLHLIDCTPNEIVEKAMNLVNGRAKEKGVFLHKDLSCSAKFNVDHEQIEQVVLNLLINGIEATGSFGQVKVVTQCSNGSVEIVVTDTGCGFAQEEMEKILQPFYSTKRSGTGLGLAISNRIVEAHKGKLQMHSKRGTGSTFTVEIPVDLDEADIT